MASKNGLTSGVGGLVLVAVLAFLVLYHQLAASQHTQQTTAEPTEEMRGVAVVAPEVVQTQLSLRRGTCVVTLSNPWRWDSRATLISPEATKECLAGLEPLYPSVPYKGTQGCLALEITLASRKKVKHPRYSAGMRWAGALDRQEIRRRFAESVPLESVCPPPPAPSTKRIVVFAIQKYDALESALQEWHRDARPFGKNAATHTHVFLTEATSLTRPATSFHTNVAGTLASFLSSDTLAPADRVVLVLADSGGAEIALIASLLSGNVMGVVDEVYVNCASKEWVFGYGGSQTGLECLSFITAMRYHGIYVHQWW